VTPDCETPEDRGLELLRTEAAFWRELIGECDGESSPECIERMQQALALAERRIEIRNRSAEHGHESRYEPARLQ
jgi:hypothetical protein